MSIDPAKKYTMTLHTSQGDIVIALNAAKAPHSVELLHLPRRPEVLRRKPLPPPDDPGHLRAAVRRPDRHRHRRPRLPFADENLTGATYPTGTVAMANAGPNTNGSQFFLGLQGHHPAPELHPVRPHHLRPGRVQKVAAGGTNNSNSQGDGLPKISVVLTSVTVTAGDPHQCRRIAAPRGPATNSRCRASALAIGEPVVAGVDLVADERHPPCRLREQRFEQRMRRDPRRRDMRQSEGIAAVRGRRRPART